ncbi:MAG: SRPBCC family protein [Acidimicrobiia bacterium]
MSSVTASIDVDLPVSTVYNQWTQFEEFPEFMEGVEKVTQRDDTHLRWVVEIAGKTKEWEAEITEQEPDQRIAWTSREGIFNAGVVTFHRLDDQRTRVALQMEFEPETFTERAGDAVGIVQRRVEGDLERFKEFIEARGEETGAWRGRV